MTNKRKQRNKRLYDYRAYQGCDASLEESLFCYGLIWKQIGKDYKFIYGVGNNGNGDYNRFDYGFMPMDTNIKDEYNWADFDAVLSFVGMTESEWLAMPLPQQILDLSSYYGYDNVFGSSYYSFEISGNNG